MDELPAPPDGFVAVLPGVNREEALVVQGYLDSNGIRAVAVGARAGLHSYTREPSRTLSVYVPADRADEARELLEAGEGEPVTEPGADGP